MESLTKVKVVQLNNVHVGWIGNDTRRVAVLLGKYAQYDGSEHCNDFRIHNYTDISLDRPWKFYEHLEPLSVQYDGGISLLGLALGQGGKEFSAEQSLRLERERPLWIALNWEISPDLEVDYSVSLRLYNSEGEVAFQEDSPLWDPLHQPTSDWETGEKTDTLFQFNLPACIPSGSYELRLVVYNVESLVLTVQVGVWEPEVTLAQLRLEDSD